MLIDTHSHIFSVDFIDDVDEVILRAYNEKVKKIILPNIDTGSIKKLNDLTDAYPHICFPTMGLHPTSVDEDYSKELKIIEYWLSKRKYYGIGETGIDLHWSKQHLNEQKKSFIHQINLAKENGLPIIIHVRDSFNEVIEIVENEQNGDLKGVFHCFSGSTDDAKRITDLNFYLGIGGVVTFKNSNLSESIKPIDLKHIVLETDSPYLAPTPYRGKRNESSYLTYIAEKLAEVYNKPTEEIEQVTTQNAQNLFSI